MDPLESDAYPVPLSKVLQSPYHLVYAVPLLILSVPLAFAGAFLTLDRTRSFVPADQVIREKTVWRFEGGLGGLLGGWIFGVHLSTMLSLLIMNRTSAAPLGPVRFLVIWLLSSVAMSLFAVRFKLAAVTLIGLGGGVAFALFTVVVCHPAHLARGILLAVFSTISAILCFVPIPTLQHAALRASAAWLGSLGIIMSISLLAKYSSWADVWSRLWVSWSSEWGTSQEKGLSAAFAGLAAAGALADWALKRQFGECPDEKWDAYLASYAANLPSANDRSGSFTPSLPLWKKLFNPPPKPPIAFPPDKALLPQTTPTPFRTTNAKSITTRPASSTSFRPLKAKDDFSSGSDSDSDTDDRYIPRPWAKRKATSISKASLSGATLAGSDPPSKDKGKARSVEMDYSDGESVTKNQQQKGSRDAPGWTPDFIRRHSSGVKSKDVEVGSVELEAKRNEPPPGAVPMTPSLLKALDRVSQAQSVAYAASSAPATPGSPVKMPQPGGGNDWGVFWRNVEEKAKEADQPTRRPTGL